MDLPSTENSDGSASKSPSQPRYASIASRVAASACDILILVVLIGSVPQLAPSVIHEIANLTLTFTYYAVLLSLKGRTLGQHLLGQVVLSDQHTRLSIGTAIRRTAWIILSYLLLGIPFLTIAFTKRRQALHDIMTETVVLSGHRS
jgi:uncharacterized RDD family membrane protein YckC